MCHPNGLLFHQKSLDLDPYGKKKKKKILRRGPHSTKKCKEKKLVKSAIFEVEKPLEICADLRKFGKKTVKSAILGRGFRLQAVHPIKK